MQAPTSTGEVHSSLPAMYGTTTALFGVTVVGGQSKSLNTVVTHRTLLHTLSDCG